MCYKQAFHHSGMHRHSNFYRNEEHPFKHFMKHKMRSFSETPPANVEELDDKYILSIYAPGFDKSDFEIRIKDDTLIIMGKVTIPESEDPHRWRRREFIATPFERYFQLNEKVDKQGIHAKYEDGLLTIELPKLENFISESQQIEIH
jgi:HSP20 family protein